MCPSSHLCCSAPSGRALFSALARRAAPPAPPAARATSAASLTAAAALHGFAPVTAVNFFPPAAAAAAAAAGPSPAAGPWAGPVSPADDPAVARLVQRSVELVGRYGRLVGAAERGKALANARYLLAPPAKGGLGLSEAEALQVVEGVKGGLCFTPASADDTLCALRELGLSQAEAVRSLVAAPSLLLPAADQLAVVAEQLALSLEVFGRELVAVVLRAPGLLSQVRGGAGGRAGRARWGGRAGGKPLHRPLLRACWEPRLLVCGTLLLLLLLLGSARC